MLRGTGFQSRKPPLKPAQPLVPAAQTPVQIVAGPASLFRSQRALVSKLLVPAESQALSSMAAAGNVTTQRPQSPAFHQAHQRNATIKALKNPRNVPIHRAAVNELEVKRRAARGSGAMGCYAEGASVEMSRPASRASHRHPSDPVTTGNCNASRAKFPRGKMVLK